MSKQKKGVQWIRIKEKNEEKAKKGERKKTDRERKKGGEKKMGIF